MRVAFHRGFRKQFQRLNDKDRRRFAQRLKLFLTDPFDPQLRNHALAGEYADCRSINAGGDLRAIYTTIENGRVIFIAIGTHSQLYG